MSWQVTVFLSVIVICMTVISLKVISTDLGPIEFDFEIEKENDQCK